MVKGIYRTQIGGRFRLVVGVTDPCPPLFDQHMVASFEIGEGCKMMYPCLFDLDYWWDYVDKKLMGVYEIS